MPTYQYVCTECGEPLEAVQAFTDDALTTCPVCGGQLRKVYSAVGVVFKGSGFYRNDSRTAAAAKSGRGSGSDGGSTKDTSTSTEQKKPAAEGSPTKSGSTGSSATGGSSTRTSGSRTKTSGSGSAA